MRFFSRQGQVIAAAVLTALFFFSTAGWAQSNPQKRLAIRFDIRRYAALMQPAGGAGAPGAAKLAEQRRTAAMAAMAQPGSPRTRVLRFNAAGLPKAVLHAGGVPAGAPDEPLALARNYLRGQAALFPFSENDLAGLRTVATSRSSGLTFLTLSQTVNGIPVFGGNVRIAFDAGGAVLHAGVDDVMPGLAVDTRPQLQPADAARRALEWLKVAATGGPLAGLPSSRAGRSMYAHPEGAAFGPIAVELSVFPLTESSARLAYRVFAGSRRGRFEMLFDAADGRLLYAADLVRQAGQARVWRESPIKGPRESVNLPDSWLPPGATITSGNNTDTYLDVDGDDEPDLYDIENTNEGRAFSPAGVFDFPAGEGSTGQDPGEFRAAAVTSAFYFVNVAHDYFQGLGFDELSGNYQADNFGRGGEENDAVLTHVQDLAIFGGARSLPAPEGLSAVIELGIAPQGTIQPDDDRDFALDGEVVIHEYGHAVTDRIVGGPQDVGCLFAPQFYMQAGALSEGWSDYFATSYFSDPVAGEYSANDSERGIRRYAYNRHPLTYEDLGNEGFEVHDDGEIWAATLWDVRQALGAEVTDQLVMDALRLTPCGPSMIDARDAILDADQAAHGGSHHLILWRVFSERGMGHSASGSSGGFLNTNVFNAAFDSPPGPFQNQNPTITSRPEQEASVGLQYSYQVRAADADADPLSYELLDGPPGMEVSASGRVSFTPNSLVPPRAKVAVTDGKGGRVVHGFSIPVFPVLTAGRPIVIEGPAFEEGYAYFTVSPGRPLLQITLRGGDGDPDLTVFGPDDSVLDSFRLGANETITIANPAPGPWLILVTAAEPYSGTSLAFDLPSATDLAVNSRLSSLQGPESSETFYRFTVPEGASSFTVSTGGGSGDLDLFVAKGRYPVCQLSFAVSQSCDFDDLSLFPGTFETITVDDSVGAFAARSGLSAASGAMRLTAADPVTVPVVESGEWFVNLSAEDSYQGVTLTLTVNAADSLAPAISEGGAVNAASYAPQLAPGGIASLFGENFASAEAEAGAVPLPREMGGVRVFVEGVEAPLFYVSPRQINFQTPFETTEGPVAVVVERDGVPSAVMEAAVQRNAPGIFTYQPLEGTAAAVITHLDGAVVTPASPARAGEALVVYATGVGGLLNPPATGESALADPLAFSTIDPSVTVGGLDAKVLFAGLAPDYVGLVQINVQLPGVLPAGAELELVARFGPDATQTVQLAIE
jgi:uncharacterized protein (TIGR03437 family)